MDAKKIGEVNHYEEQSGNAYILLCAVLKCGDTIHFLGHGNDFQQNVTSIQIENESILQANAGDLVAVRTSKTVKRGASVYLLSI